LDRKSPEARSVGEKLRLEPSGQMKLVGVGGTFDILHAGHKRLLRAALHSAEKVQIGLTSDEFVKRMGKTHKVNTYSLRAETIRKFLAKEKALSRTEILCIDDSYGTAIRDPNLEGLVTSEETLSMAKEINTIRQDSGLSPLKLIVVELLAAEDGKPISARRIRNGEITCTGKTTVNPKDNM